MDQYEKLEKIGEGTYGKVEAGLFHVHDVAFSAAHTDMPLPEGVQSQGHQHRQAGCPEEDSARGKAPGPCDQPTRCLQLSHWFTALLQMEEEGVPSTTLREISLLQMLSESNHIVK